MAKSKIINDIITNNTQLSVIFKRLYIIFSYLDQTDHLEWVNHEVRGYGDDEAVPEYRKLKCLPIGSYEVLGRPGIVYENKTLPMINLPDDIKEVSTNINIKMSISALENALEGYKIGNSVGYPIPMNMWPYFQNGVNIAITSANRVVNEVEFRRCIASIESKVLEILFSLEKEYGCLDKYDVVNEFIDNNKNISNDKGQNIYENCNFYEMNSKKNLKVGKNSSKHINKNSNNGSFSADKKLEVSVNLKEKKKDCWIVRKFKKLLHIGENKDE